VSNLSTAATAQQPCPDEADVEAKTKLQPVDPGSVLASLGLLAYSWDPISGALSFAGDVRQAFPGEWGHNFETIARLDEAMIPPRPGARRAALFGAERLDDGSGVPYSLTYRLRSKDGRLYLVEESGRWFACLPGHPMLARGLLRARQLASELREEGAVSSPRSKFFGRSSLGSALKRAVEQATRTHRSFALIGVAVSQKYLGPEDGQHILNNVGEGFVARLRRVMRRGDILVRIDDQMSLCLLSACDETQMGNAVTRLKTAFKLSCEDEAAQELVGTVAGAVWKGPHANAQALATAVIDEARAHLEGMGEEVSPLPLLGTRGGRQSIDWHHEIVTALNEGRLALACQPVVHAASRSIAFHEGLLRLRNREGRLLPASVFVPCSEEAGLISLLDQRVVELAAEELIRHPDLKVSINASPLSLLDPEWLASLRSHAASTKAFAGRLILEVTESAALADIQRTSKLLGAVKELGIAVAIDDFGSGHTSFRTLRQLPVDIVKIDGAFMQDVDRSSDGRFFIRTLVELAHHIGCKVVAEWVENEAAARIVEDIGVDYLQGRLLGTPLLLAAPELQASGRVSARLTA
jgi:EAL domain-containing protein (putative c-di-GMP-specific phosphodiesterase class I)